jgi:hypothetical protein
MQVLKSLYTNSVKRVLSLNALLKAQPVVISVLSNQEKLELEDKIHRKIEEFDLKVDMKAQENVVAPVLMPFAESSHENEKKRLLQVVRGRKKAKPTQLEVLRVMPKRSQSKKDSEFDWRSFIRGHKNKRNKFYLILTT